MTNGRVKGKAAEREVVNLLRAALPELPDIRRNLDQTRAGGYDILGVPGFAIEVKRHEKGFQASWWAQTLKQAAETEQAPALFYRASRRPWRVRFVLSLYEKRYVVEAALEEFIRYYRENHLET